jgi:preprotein translocase subunit SecG
MTKMNAKNVMVSMIAILSVLFLAVSISSIEYGTDYNVEVEVNDFDVNDGSNAVQVIAGETIKVEVVLTALNGDRDVTVEVELDTGKEEVKAISESFRISAGSSKRVVLSLRVPYELKDELNDTAILTVEIDGKETADTFTYELFVERTDYSAEVKSVIVSQSVDAGELFPVDIVLKNVGYLNLDDVYVTAKISALGIESTGYFGDLVSMESEDDDDDEDSASGRLMLEIPYNAEAGVYTLEVEVTNDDTTTTVVKQIVVKNDFASNVIVSTYKRTVATGEDAVYELLIVNPTNKVKVYRLVSIDGSDVTTSGDAIIAIPAGSSKAVKITASTDTEGEFNFDVNIFSGEELVETVSLTLEAKGSSNASLSVVLTVILAIIFVVLLVVLIVLIGKKPAKAEEFGESYY